MPHVPKSSGPIWLSWYRSFPTHLIADVESVLDEAIFLKEGKVVLHQSVDELRDSTGKSVDEYFREVFKC